jgi:hypothetical protein
MVDQKMKFEDEDQDEIDIVLKPMNLSEVHKRKVEMKVRKDQNIRDFAQTLVNIL